MQQATGAAGGSGGGRVEHFVFIIHPLLYETIEPSTSALQLYAAWEREVKACCLTELAALPTTTSMVIQLAGGSTELIDAARCCLGSERTLHLRPDGEQTNLADLYVGLVKRIHQHLTSVRLTFDASSATAESWGESFEGCVPGYGGAFAHGLGLVQQPTIRFDLCVCDATFMYGATLLLTVPVMDEVGELSDVEGMVFQLHDRTFVAVFQSRRTPMWIDERVIAVGGHGTVMQMDLVRAITKQGYPIWPSVPPGSKGLYQHSGTVPQEVRFRLSESGAANDEITYLHGLKVSEEDFVALVRGSRVLGKEAELLRPATLASL